MVIVTIEFLIVLVFVLFGVYILFFGIGPFEGIGSSIKPLKKSLRRRIRSKKKSPRAPVRSVPNYRMKMPVKWKSSSGWKTKRKSK